MKGIALNLTAVDSSVYKAEIEMGIVSNDHGAGAMVLADVMANFLKNIAQGVLLTHCVAVGIVRVNAGKFEGGIVTDSIDVGNDIAGYGSIADQEA